MDIDRVVITDTDIPGLSLVDFGSILGISLLTSAANSTQGGEVVPITNLSQKGLCGEAVASEDSYFVRHSSHVAGYALTVANAMCLSVQLKKAIYVAGFLHDIGKLQVAPSILYKKGPLTPEEYENMKMHPMLGMKMLLNVTFPWPVKPLILYHHERCDGSGYPQGLAGKEIPVGAKIIGVVDFVDAFTASRLYHRAHSLDELIERLITYTGTIFDEVVCCALMDMIESGAINVSLDSEQEDERISELGHVLAVVDGEDELGRA